MDIEWNWEFDDEFLGEKLPADTLDRKKYAKYLYETCAARGEKSSLVVNINAEWGAGKTYFTKRLAKTIKNRHPTIYIDAWKEDFSEDPLLTVFSSIKEQLTGQSDKFTTLINSTIENIGPLLKTATPVIIEGLVKKFTGIDSASKLGKDLSSKLLEIHSEKSKKIEAIRKGIARWVEFIERKDCIDKELPIFIVIDELDRCRPSYAISLLEITKHIFNIPGVVFIIATDTDQLQHSIKVIYGNNFSASHYLSRFFDRRFLLPSPNIKNLLITRTGEQIASDFLSWKFQCLLLPPSFIGFITNCASIFQSLKINIRDTIKIYDRLIDLLLITDKKIDPNLILILMALNFKENEVYARIKKGESIDPSSFLFQIDLSFDLSSTTTGIRYIKSSSGGYTDYNNGYLNLTTDVISYVNNAKVILKTPNIKMDGNRQFNTVEGWLNGDITDHKDVSNFLKLGYALNKLNNTELKFGNYFDLIELSTTFE
ncbi:TPA: P-loop NTPase fold protein [Citrobacter freundii]